MFLPPEVTINSFFRPVIRRKPSQSSSPEVARQQPAVADGVGRVVRAIPIAEHHVRPAGEDFAVGGDADLDSGDRAADGAELVGRRRRSVITGDDSVSP